MQIPKHEQGMTLVEVLAAVFVFVIGLAALMKLQSNLWYQESFAKQENEALILAAQKVEQLRNYQVINTTAGFNAYADILSGNSTSAGTNATYTITWTVTTNTSPNYKNISITVSWTDSRAVAQSTTLVTDIAQIDPAASGSLSET